MGAEPPPLTVVAGVRVAMSTAADHVAVTGVGTELTFAALDERVGDAADRLEAAGVTPGAFVSVEIDRSPDAITCILALWHLGAAYVPLDPSTPAAYRSSMLDTASGLLSHRITPAHGNRPGWDVTAADPATRPSTPRPPDDTDAAAYAMFTSGTSGHRRLTVVGHRQLDHLLTGLAASVYADVDPSTQRVALNGPLAFDTSVKQLIQLAHGATLVLVPPEVRLDGTAMRRHLNDHEVTVVDATPGLVRHWLRHERLSGPGGSIAELLVVGGEAIDSGLWTALSEIDSMAAYNVYGPTECTVDTTACRITGRAPHLGGPLSGVTVEVEDRHGPVAPYTVGELVIGGSGVAWGYVGDDQGGFIDGPAGRRYRTGDLARRHPDGRLEFIGRADDQIKSNGVRVDLSEIDALVRESPRVTAAAAAVTGDGALVAVVTVDSPADTSMAVTGDDIRAELATRAPLALVPTVIAVTDSIPLGERGKVDRSAVRDAGVSPGAVPTDDLEVFVAGAMADIVGGAPFRRDESFFRRGGDSLAVLELAALIADEVGAEVDIARLVDHPTPRAVAAQIAEPTTPPPRPISEPPQLVSADPGPSAERGGTDDRLGQLTRRPLTDAIACGVIGRLDAAAVNCVPDVARVLLGRGDELRSLMEGIPLLAQVRRCSLGTLGVILVPYYATEAARIDPAAVDAAVNLAATFGARAVSLTGELAAGTNYGADLAHRADGPMVSTGQGSTVASMLTAWQAAVSARGSTISDEHVGVIGAGALTAAFVDALAAADRKPASVRALDRDHPEGSGVTSVVVTGTADHTWLLDTVAAGTPIVEYGTSLKADPSDPSGPWVINGGTLRAPTAMESLTYVHDRVADRAGALVGQVLDDADRTIAACACAALLVAAAEAPPVRGVPAPSVVAAYQGAQHRCGYLVDAVAELRSNP